jgi:hypothetical protein
MIDVRTQAIEAVTPLLAADEDTLFAELGIRASALAEDPAAAGSFDPHVTYSEAQMGAMDDVRALGRRLFRRWNRELHALICGNDPDDEKERSEVAAAIGLGQTGFAAYLATLLVSSFGLAPAIAAVVAAILVRRLFRPAIEELCVAWGESLG